MFIDELKKIRKEVESLNDSNVFEFLENCVSCEDNCITLTMGGPSIWIDLETQELVGSNSMFEKEIRLDLNNTQIFKDTLYNL